MSSRSYDYELNVAFQTHSERFVKGAIVVGKNTNTVGTIIAVHSANIKVKVDNVFTAFRTNEIINVQQVNTTGGSANNQVVPYISPAYSSTELRANAVITAITRSNFIAAKNAFTSDPPVRLYDIFYPGEWYPPTANNNPGGPGLGLAWPTGFPYRFAEVVGDQYSDLDYRATHDGKAYIVIPMEVTNISTDSEAKVNEVTVRISNHDGLLAALVENSYIAGNCSLSTNTSVNGDQVYNIDPKTIPTHPSFDQDYTNTYYAGANNSPFTKTSCEDGGGTWTKAKLDSRDLLGGIVRIRQTYANLLDYWPEYSQVRATQSNVYEVYSSMPYRIGDNVTSSANTAISETIVKIDGNYIQTSATNPSFDIGHLMYIINPDADPDAYIEDVFKINALSGLNEQLAEFSLVSWLQYFKLALPKRRYAKNSCPWTYLGDECQYPESGTGTIPGTNLQANGWFNINNEQVFTQEEDACAHNPVACNLRRNIIHFGAYPATGASITVS